MSRRQDTLPSYLSLSQLARINELCNRFEAAWRTAQRPQVEDYLGDAPNDPAVLQQLLLLDIDYRQQHGDTPELADYLARFPQLDPNWLRGALAQTGPLGSPDPPARLDVSAEELLHRLAQQNVLPDEQSALRQRLQAEPTLTATALARQLVEEGKLAEFQARALTASLSIPLRLGPYVLDGWIASGGMGDVFRATHQRMKRVVAVKVVQANAADRPELLRRFQREVEVAARLRHPNIVTAFDAGEQDGVAYLVTEFIEGADLGRLVGRDGPLPVDRAVDVLRQAAIGLAYAHTQGIVHRDVKPSNLILGRDGIVRVLDVGLARAAGSPSDWERARSSANRSAPNALTEAGAVMGTPDYVAPEQVEDAGQVDERADVYSLGCTLHYLLTGRPPYEAATVLGLLRAHQRAPVPSLRVLLPEVPAALDKLFAQMLAKEPQERPSGMAAVLKALDGALLPPRRFHRRRLVVAAGAALAGVAGWFVLNRTRPTPAPPQPPRIPFDARAEQQRWAAALDLPVTKSVLGMPFVLIPPGSFTTGTPEQEANVGPFYLAATEVTVGQFRRFVKASQPEYVTLAERESGWGLNEQRDWIFRNGFSWQAAGELKLTDEHPVVNIAYDDAEAFCRWMTDKSQSLCRLPTEVEWEFACRAGSAGLWCFGDDVDQLPLYAWTRQNSDDAPQPVGRKRPNAFGLYDMHGNQYEWCRPEAEQRADLKELPVRGGSFHFEADRTRSAARHWLGRFDVIPGFRVLQVIEATS